MNLSLNDRVALILGRQIIRAEENQIRAETAEKKLAELERATPENADLTTDE